MKRRDFLLTTAGAAGTLLPGLGFSQSKPCPPSTFGIAGGASVATSCTAVDAEADWISRSRAPGVVWAHDFRHPDEVDQFRFQTGNYPEITRTDGSCRRTSQDGITGGGCLEIEIPGNPRVNVVKATRSNPIVITTDGPIKAVVGEKVRFQGMSGGFSALNDSSGGGGGTIVAQTVGSVISDTSFTVLKDGTGYEAYAGAGNCSTAHAAKSGWHRPFSAVLAGRNGLPESDIGGLRGEHPLRDWTAKTDSRTDWRWRQDYYGHADYHRQFPTWRNSVTEEVEQNPWRGTDFWIQFACKTSRSRWQFLSTGTGNPSGKLIFIETTGVQALQQIVIRSEDSNEREGYPTTFETKHMRLYTGGGYSRNMNGHRNGTELLQPGGVYDNESDPDLTCRYYSPKGSGRVSNHCWRWPKDEWVTVLVHVIPGHHVPEWAGWPAGGDTGVQVWVAPHSQLANGYLKILDVNDFPFVFDTGGLHPPGWNLLKLSGYMNNVPASVGWTQRFDQVIFSRKFIACPRG